MLRLHDGKWPFRATTFFDEGAAKDGTLFTLRHAQIRQVGLTALRIFRMGELM